uniref:non-specific serine/threonine protein kinase n=1 Tax=Caenorhabditis tropicalis TaxID=1561998 RepID=A0A1I7TME3_9PELO
MEDIQAITEGKVCCSNRSENKLPIQIIAKRWKVVEKLGEGGMGAVFKVRDITRFQTYAAMKVEGDVSDGGVLKLEAHVLKALAPLPFCARLLDAGDRKTYCFMVMTLLGKDLMAHKREANIPKLCEQTTLRLAMATLFAIKQIHEVGFTHRDIKPGNCVTGVSGSDAKNIYLIDYGMVRQFTAKRENGAVALRKARSGEQLFRGTPRYCSMNVHNRKEQGRVDDLWSWLYMLIELHCGLPWRRLTDEKEIMQAKSICPMDTLLKGCPKEFANIHKYLETLEYKSRPDYFGLWSECFSGFKRVRGSFFGRFEWELNNGGGEDMFTALSISEKRAPNDFKVATKMQMAKKIWPYADSAHFKKKILNL